MDIKLSTRGRILLLFLLADIINIAAANTTRTLRKLNSKINLIKTTFEKHEKELDELKYTVLDLSTELDFERYRTDELERQLNETLQEGVELEEGDTTKGSPNTETNRKLVDKLNKQEKQLKQMDQELKEEKTKRLSMEATVESMKEKCDLIDNHETLIKSQQTTINDMKENLTNIAKSESNLEQNIYSTESLKNETHKIRTSMRLFTYSIKTAFKAEKTKLRNLSRSLKSDKSVAEMVKKEFEAITSNTNISLDSIRNGMTDLQNNVGDVLELVRGVEINLDTLNSTFADYLHSLNSTVALIEVKVEANEKGLDKVSGCCSHQPTAAGTTRRPSSTTVTSLVPVTLAPGGPSILPLYEEELAKAIKIGSRVVRGRDWSWHSQDGNPPGPGTVLSWYGGSRSTRQVMVQWDRGTKAKYRIGSLGKYDLYLLADEPADEGVKPGPDQPNAAGITQRPSPTTVAPLVPVTLVPGGPSILPLYEEELAKAIKIGSRVVRGRDWSWGNQDGSPPTPGTVTAWYRGKKSTKAVTVKWDSGHRNNYRVGAEKKYDLYLLKDQSSYGQ